MKLSKVLFAGLALVCAQAVFAGKVVIFDAQQAILQTDHAKQRMDELQKKPEYAKLVAEAEGLKAELATLSKNAESQGLTWSAEKQAEHRKNVEFVQGDFQRVVQKIKKENDDLMQGLLADGQQKIPAILDKIVKAEGIDIVLRREAAFIAMPAADVTAKVIAELNKDAKK